MSYGEQLEYLEYLFENDTLQYRGHESYHEELKSKVKISREKNGYNETKNIQSLIDHLNNKTLLGKSIINKLKTKLCIDFKEAVIRKSSNRKTHYDFTIIDTNDVEYKVEHKGSYLYKEIKETDKPWTSGVQFANISCDKFEISRIYASIWYDEYIYSNYLSDVYKITEAIPTFNTWYKMDCCTQGNPKTLYGKKLKEIYRNEYGKTSLLHLRKKVNEKFLEKTTEDPSLLERFGKEIEAISKSCLSEKDIWIQINGNIEDHTNKNVCFEVYGKQTFTIIKNIKCSCKSDIDFTFDSELNFKAKLRWGKGCGFSNLRIDFN